MTNINRNRMTFHFHTMTMEFVILKIKSPTTQTMISNFPTFAVVTLRAGGKPILACIASPLMSAKSEI